MGILTLKPVDMDDPSEGCSQWQRTGVGQVTAISVMVPLIPDVPWICVSTGAPGLNLALA